jgi:ABC-2 type transport system ATP-binding protein
MTAAVEAHDLGRRYGSLVALEGLTFTARGGEIVGVLGRNGAGKTTTIRVLTTILAPTTGCFSVADVPHVRPSELRARIGVLPESAGYPPRQCADEYLRFHARLFGHSRASARATAAALLEEVGLGDRAGALIATYSRGMRQRLGIARALVNEPLVVFLDEPTLGLDPAGQRQVLAHVETMARRRGTAIILSTHLLAEVEEHCSRVLILHHGRVVADGTVAEVARRAAAPRAGRLEVAPGAEQQAMAELGRVPGVATVAQDGDGPGALRVTFAERSEAPLNVAVHALVEAGIELRAFELERARLSDAFLTMTQGARP